MIVNELFKCWLCCESPNAILKVWDRSEGDYIFITNLPLTPSEDAKNILRMKVKCFYEIGTKGKNPTLIVNVGEYE